MKIKFIFGTVLSSFFLVTFLLVGFVGFSQTTPIPDPNFEQALIDAGIDTNGKNGNILNSDAVDVTYLDMERKGIESLAGIEAFTSLILLSCTFNKLTSLDVSKNTALTDLFCFNNQLTSLDFSKNTALMNLYCHLNQLISLDVSKNTALATLYCDYNQLTSLDVSKNISLATLGCSGNQLTSLNMQNINLAITFYAFNNPNLRCIQVDD